MLCLKKPINQFHLLFQNNIEYAERLGRCRIHFAHSRDCDLDALFVEALYAHYFCDLFCVHLYICRLIWPSKRQAERRSLDAHITVEFDKREELFAVKSLVAAEQCVVLMQETETQLLGLDKRLEVDAVLIECPVGLADNLEVVGEQLDGLGSRSLVMKMISFCSFLLSHYIIERSFSILAGGSGPPRPPPPPKPPRPPPRSE